jgi:hypothetical protein
VVLASATSAARRSMVQRLWDTMTGISIGYIVVG